MDPQPGPAVHREPFGAVGDRPVDRFTLTAGGTRVRLLTYGALVQTVEVPDRDGRVANVALGFADVDGYVASDAYLGAVVGRFANRLAGGRFVVHGDGGAGDTAVQVPPNDGPNALHGGPQGFDRAVWEASVLNHHDAAAVAFEHVSPDGDMGFPGMLRVRVIYRLTPDGVLRLHFTATTDRTTVVNLTNHAYWNLAGEGSGSALGEELEVLADAFTPVDATLIPTGEVLDVEGTPFDFRAPTPIGARVRSGHPQLVLARGYDHNWVLRPAGAGALRVAATTYEPGSGRTLTVRTTEPGLQFYSGNFLDGTAVGTSGRVYRQGDGYALETQHFPDAPNHPAFPSTVLRPDDTFRSTTEYVFGVR